MFYAFSLKYVVPMLHTYHIPFYSLGSNGQRPGAIINMEVQEEEKATEEEVDGVRVLTIKVCNHKTGMLERAGIGLCGETIEHLNHWMKVRRILLPDSTLVFLSWKGEIIQNLTTKVRTLAQSFGLDLHTTREVRSNVEIRATSIDSTKQTLVARHLSHSNRSAEKSYRALEA